MASRANGCRWIEQPTAARSLDFEKTQLQQSGSVSTIGLTLAQVVEVVTDIGLRLDEVEIAHGIVVKR